MPAHQSTMPQISMNTSPDIFCWLQSCSIPYAEWQAEN